MMRFKRLQKILKDPNISDLVVHFGNSKFSIIKFSKNDLVVFDYPDEYGRVIVGGGFHIDPSEVHNVKTQLIWEYGTPKDCETTMVEIWLRSRLGGD